MSDNIPFNIQKKIMKSLPAKSLIQFRSVSKLWKSVIDSSEFIVGHSIGHTHEQRLLIRCTNYGDSKPKYVSFVDDETFPLHKTFPTVPNLVNLLNQSRMVGSSHGLFCLYGTDMAVVWNPIIRKTVSIVVPELLDWTYETVFGFGVVCLDNHEAKIMVVKICRKMDFSTATSTPWQVDIFTLSSGAWRRRLCSNPPHESIRFGWTYHQEVIDGFIYWHAIDFRPATTDDDVEVKFCNMILSFNMTKEEFGEIKFPASVAHRPPGCISISVLRGSLAVVEAGVGANRLAYGVWMIKDGLFTKLFTVNPPDATIITALVGFRKTDAPIMLKKEEYGELFCPRELVVYEPGSELINELGIYGVNLSFSAYSYIETLLLLDHLDSSTIQNI